MITKKSFLALLLAGAVTAGSIPFAFASENEVVGEGSVGQSDVTLSVERTTHSSGGHYYPSYVETFTINISKTEGVKISPVGKVSVDQGESLTITVQPEDGYEVLDVLVDGESRGVLERFTFNRVSKSHTFKVVAGPKDGWEHIAYINGYPDGGMHPENNITRAEVAAIFYRLLSDSEREEYETTDSSFTDIEDSWAKKEIATLENAGILKGYEKNGELTFHPTANITRAEYTAIVSRFGDPEEGEEDTFEDVDSSHWASEEIAAAAATGWIEGYPDGTFRPDNNITRAEAVKITNKVTERSCDKVYLGLHPDSITQFNDIDSSHWAYFEVVEASTEHRSKTVDGAETWVALDDE